MSAGRNKYGAKGPIPLGESVGHALLEVLAKLKPLKYIFHDFQQKNLMYRFDLNDNALFTLSKT